MNRIILTVLFLCASQFSHAASVWKVTKGDQTVYVGGTIHILSASDYPLPEQYSTAYEASQKLIFETDMAALQTMEFQQKTMQLMTYQDGRTFRDELSPEVVTAVEAHLQARGIPVQNVLPFKPSLLSVTLSVIELQLAGLTSEGVDQYYTNLATKDNKAIGWLESPDQQLQFLVNLGKGQENELMQYTLAEMSSISTWVDELRAQWRSGDMDALADAQITEMKAEFPEVYQDLLVTRNNNWMPQIKAMFNTPEVEFVLVGTLHLAGPESVLTMLEKDGYTVEML